MVDIAGVPGSVDTNSLAVRQTGLYLQDLWITNIASLPLEAVTVEVTGLRPGVQVYNAMGTTNGSSLLRFDYPTAPGQVLRLRIEYYVPDGIPPAASFHVVLAKPAAPFAPPGPGTPVSIGFFVYPCGRRRRFLEFKTVTGADYYVQYSSDLTTWFTAQPAMAGNGQFDPVAGHWSAENQELEDRGSIGRRLYRVLRVPDRDPDPDYYIYEEETISPPIVQRRRVCQAACGAPRCFRAGPVGMGETALGSNQPVLTGDDVNVRSRPSLEGEVYTQVNSGTILSSLDNPGASKPGPGHAASSTRLQLPAAVPVWVHASYVQADTVRGNHLNSAAAPGRTFAVLGQFNSGDKIKVQARKGNWIQVEAPAQAEAFVAADYVKPVAPPSLASSTPAKRLAPTTLISSQVEPPKSTKPAALVSTPTVAAAAPLPSLGVSDRNSQARAEVLPNRARNNSTVASLAPPLLSEPAKADGSVRTAPATARSLPEPATPVNSPAPVLSASVKQALPTPIPETAASAQTEAAVAAVQPQSASNPAGIASTRIPQPSIILAKAEETHTPEKAVDPGSPDDGRFKLELPPPTPKNEFSVGYFLTWNTSAHFQNSGGLLFPAPAGGLYNDGYVLPSSRGNIDGYTWNWGYRDASQYDAANDRLILSRSSVVAGGGFGDHNTSDSDMNQGVEFGYHHILWEHPDQDSRLGFEASFGYGSMTFSDNRNQTADLRIDQDAYALQGVHPPGAPYYGTFQGPGPLLFNGPQALPSVMIANGAMISSMRTLNSDMYNLRLGLRLGVDLTPHLFGMASAGLAIMMVDGDFSYRDTWGNLQVAGHQDKFSVLPGGYVGLGLGYHLSEHWGLSYQVHFQYNETYEQHFDGRSVSLGLQPIIFQTFGLSYSF